MKLTQWHDGSVKPVHKGVYERSGYGSLNYSLWNGKRWNFSARTVEMAKYEIAPSLTQFLKWRGLANKPK
jgi:hypothetical protein